MKKLFDDVITNITNLIMLRQQQITLLQALSRNTDAIPLSFKIKNYNIWIKELHKCIKKTIDIKTKDDITKLKLVKGLETKVIELFETGNISDIEEAQANITQLNKELSSIDKDKTNIDIDKIANIDNTGNTGNINTDIDTIDTPASLYNSITSMDIDDSIDVKNTTITKKKATTPKTAAPKTTTPKPTIPKPKTPKAKNKNSLSDSISISDTHIDTSLIESQPKILNDEIRPTDERGGAMYDIRYLYGVGPKSAEKLVDSGLTLEKLLTEWTTWIAKDINNSVLMFSKMPIPVGYTKMQWNSLPEERQNNIHLSILTDKLKRETQYLQLLNTHQILGVKYFHDMSQKIPRYEVQKAERILISTAQHMNKDITLTLCGSYRRGTPKSGDIDCLITHKDIKTQQDMETSQVNILASFVILLTDLGFLVDHLTDYGKTKYMGFCIVKQRGKQNPTARRIDIRFIPFNSYGSSILYFTGSKKFNTQMRSHALSKGYSLNEYGLKKLSDNITIPCKTEEEVFTILQYPYKTPAERNI